MKSKYKVVVDSCCELPENLLNDERFEVVPLTLEIGDVEIVDDNTFDQKDFLKKVAESKECPKSACPSPDSYLKTFASEAEHIYVITLSSKLSGSYNSACLAKSMFEEENTEKKIFIIDSKSASCGETQIVLKIMDLEEQGCSFEEVTSKVQAFIDDMQTFFVLDNLDTLRKNGRLSTVKAAVASTLNIKPVMGATKEGSIEQKGQAVGMYKAIAKMVDSILSEVKSTENRRLVISHCNCRERAEKIEKIMRAKAKFKEIIILNTAGISSMYANDGGVVVTV